MTQDSTNLENLPPTGDDHAFLLWASPGDRESIRDAVLQKYEEVLGSTNIKDSFMTENWCVSRKAFGVFEPGLHDLWHTYYQAGKNISHESSEQDRFALDLLRIRGLGPLTRSVQDSNGSNEDAEIATTPAGVLWGDLPYFVADMTDFWVNYCAAMGATKRLNFFPFSG